MLQYIRDKRSTRGANAGATNARTVSSIAAAAASEATTPEPPASLPVATTTTERKADPYLQMLQRRSLRSTPTPGSDAGGGSGAYVARPAVIPQYEARPPRTRNAARWRIAESEFYDDECACGTKHEPLASTAKSTMLLTTMSAMMSTFGDSAQSCLFAVKEVKSLVGAHMRAVLASVNDSEEGGPSSMCLRVRSCCCCFGLMCSVSCQELTDDVLLLRHSWICSTMKPRTTVDGASSEARPNTRPMSWKMSRRKSWPRNWISLPSRKPTRSSTRRSW